MSNIWHTLDLLAGNDLRFRTDGYHDVNNWLTSFTKKDIFLGLGKGQRSTEDMAGHAAKENGPGPSSARKSTEDVKRDSDQGKTRPKRLRKFKKKKDSKKEKLPEDYGSIVDCSFNVPRITARLEGLMGSNVVRLTDRAYMHHLRQTLDAECITLLQQRIEKREAQEKERQNYLIFRGHYSPENCPNDLIIAHSISLAQEMERERNLIMQGKSEKIPEELENHPVFIVNQRTNNIIANRRSKLKTNREKNAERLIRQGAKWERERLIVEDLEKQKEMEIKARKDEQFGLEDQYRKEDAIRGLDLLRIHNREWKPCELDLKKFLETEKALMKQRLVHKSVQYSSDLMDIQNIVRARKKFRDTERKIRQQLDEKFSPTKQVYEARDFLAETAAGSAVSRKIAEQGAKKSECSLSEGEKARILRSDDGIQTDEDLSGDDVDSHPDSETDYKQVFQKDMETDTKQGFIFNKEQFDELHYEDPLIALLKKTDNVQDLYKVAREIIFGDAQEVIMEQVAENEVLSQV